MVKVKVCGITNERDLFYAVSAGADAVGFIVNVESSPRNLTLDKARELMNMVPVFVSRVAVTVVNSLQDVMDLQQKLKPDFIQVHGDQTLSFNSINSISNTGLIKAISFKNDVLKEINNRIDNFDAILVDTFVEGKFGGTGIANDFTRCRKIRDEIYPKPFILAGGLTPENVKEAVTTVKPFAVDACSGIELSPGIKDEKKLYNFIEKAKGVRF